MLPGRKSPKTRFRVMWLNYWQDFLFGLSGVDLFEFSLHLVYLCLGVHFSLTLGLIPLKINIWARYRVHQALKICTCHMTNISKSQWNLLSDIKHVLSRLMTKPTKCIYPIWSEPSLSAWKKFGPLATHWAHSKDSVQTGRIWVFAGRTATLLVMSRGGSLYLYLFLLFLSLCLSPSSPPLPVYYLWPHFLTVFLSLPFIHFIVFDFAHSDINNFLTKMLIMFLHIFLAYPNWISVNLIGARKCRLTHWGVRRLWWQDDDFDVFTSFLMSCWCHFSAKGFDGELNRTFLDRKM